MCWASIPIGLLHFLPESYKEFIAVLLLPVGMGGLFIVLGVLDSWMHDITGHPRPTPPPPSPKQKAKAALGMALAVIMTVGIWAFIVPSQTTFFNAFWSALALGPGIALLLFATYSDEFGDRYGGLGLALCVSGVFLTIPSNEDIPGLIILFVIAVPALLFHGIWRWWGNFEFVKERRRMERLKRQQAQVVLPPPVMSIAPSAPPSDITETAKRLAEKYRK